MDDILIIAGNQDHADALAHFLDPFTDTPIHTLTPTGSLPGDYPLSVVVIVDEPVWDDAWWQTNVLPHLTLATLTLHTPDLLADTP